MTRMVALERKANYFTAGYNKDGVPAFIDVHDLKVPEAIRRTEKALRDVLLNNGKELRVKTAGTILTSTHLAIIKAMQE